MAIPCPLFAEDKDLNPNERPAWLEGDKDNLKIKITGEVTDENGAAVNDFQMSVDVGSRAGETNRQVTVEKNRFYFWIHAGPEFLIKMKATSSDGKKGILKTVSAYEIRQLAIGGLKLKLLPFDHIAEVAVTDGDKPAQGAFVSANVDGFFLQEKTDKAGIARYPLLIGNTINRITAWTEDHKLGLMQPTDQGADKPVENRYSIKLAPCRTKVIRVFDKASNTPLKNLPIHISVSSGPPQKFFLRDINPCDLKTNEKGEAIFLWDPAWENSRFFFRIKDPNWINGGEQEIVNGILNLPLQKSRQDQRKPFVGKITSPQLNKAGFLVQVDSLQGEPENYPDLLYAFTDENGQFSVNCLPDATYCMYVNDARYVSNQIDMIPIAKNKTPQPELLLTPGQKVEVIFTAGPSKKPIANQLIHLSTHHHFQWLANNEPMSGRGGRVWWIRTDQNGQATTYALEGAETEASLVGQGWRSTQTLKVKSTGSNQLVFHQAFPEARKITGKLQLERGMEADLNEAILEIGSMDGEVQERKTVKTNDRGEFEFDSKSKLLGILAQTRDGKAAIVSKIDQASQFVELPLGPTAKCQGQILGKEDKPLEGVIVSLHVHVKDKMDVNAIRQNSFIGSTFQVKTNAQGLYSFTGIPTNAEISIGMRGNDNYPSRLLENFRIETNESLPRMVSHLETPALKRTFADRYSMTLRDGALSNFHTMVILHPPSKQIADFVKINLVNFATNKENGAFMQILGEVGTGPRNQEVMELARSKNWPIPKDGKISALALDGSGKELGRLEIDPTGEASPKLTAEFVRKHAPKQVDAKKKWEEAFAEAKASGRKVWVRISQRYCAPCFLLTRWLDDQKDVLSKDFIILKIDDIRDLHGQEMCKFLPESDEMGLPFHAIFDANEKLINTSKGPLGNIGYPSGFEGKKHLRKMLSQSRKKLTEKEIDDLIATLKD